MRKIYALMIALLTFFSVSAQIGITVTGNTNTTPNLSASYTSLANALTDLNAVTSVSGPVVLSCAASGTETAPAGGFVINFTAATTSTNNVTITGNGSTITASNALTVGNLNDAIFKIIGSDNITLQGFTMQENAANTTTAGGTNNMTEWGVALLYASVTDGSQNITIQNNTIDLDRNYQNSFGIYANATHTATAVTATVTATGTSGGNNGLKIFGNTITDVNNGIVIVGPTASADYNTGVDIGGSSAATANTISNFGTNGTFSSYANVSTTVNGILVRNSIGFNISYNTVSSSNGNVTAGTLNGIQVPGASNTPTGTFTNTINNNSISLRSAVASGAIVGITMPSGSASTTSTLNINNNNFNTFGHTIAASGAITFISTASTNQFTTINGNTFTNITVNTTGSVTFISHSYSIPSGGSQVINNNSIVTGFNKTGSGGTVTFTTSGASSPNGTTSSTTNNNFSNVTVTGSTAILGTLSNDGSGSSPTKIFTGNTYSNWVGGTGSINGVTYNYIGAPTSNISNNIFSNITGQGSITAITIGSTFNGATVLNVSSNSISGLSSTGAGGAVTGITCSNSSTTVNINQNTVSGLSTTAGSAVIGVSVTGASSTNVFKNKIYDLSGSNASSTVNGILVSSGTTVTVYNNLIGDLRATAANASNPLIGLSITGGTTINAYFNTIYLNGTSTGTNFGSSAVSVSSSPTVDLRNNIFVNASTPNGTGLSVAYRRSTTTLTSYASASNNNLFYAGTPGISNLIFYDGANSDQTLAAYKTRVSLRDAASVTEAPTFVSTSGSSSNFLHINTTVATQISNSGAPVSGIADDYDGDVRNVTTPDIGADEFNGITADLTAPTITYTALTNVCSGGSRIIIATITDGSGVPTSGTGLPVLYWKINSGAYTPSTGSYIGSNQYQFNLGTGTAVGDVISYYVVAQDNASTPNVSSFPSVGASGFTSSPPAASVPPSSPSIYSIFGPLTGTFTVGVGGNYSTLTAAIAEYNTKCLTGPVVFTLTDASYSTNETFPIIINNNLTSSATNSLTIRPASGITSTISGSVSSGALISINGANYVTIDGSNNASSSRNLTITNTSTTSPSVINMVSLGTGLGASNNTIKNINLSTAGAGSSYGISVGSTPGNAGADNDNITIQNNNISGVAVGIYAIGTASVSAGGLNSLNIIDNTISVNTTAAAFGIQAGNSLNSIIRGNSLSIETTSGSSPVGISLETGFVSSSVSQNKIAKVLTTSTGGWGGRGITIGTGTATSNVTIANNMIAGVNGSNFSSFSNSSSMGIAIGVVGSSSTLTTTTGGVNVVYNSVNMTGTYDRNTASCVTAAMFIGSGAGTLDVRDNILVNSLSNTNSTNGSSAKAYSIYSAAANTAFTSIDYNDYYVSGTQGVLGYLSSDRTDLAGIITGFGGNANSKNIQPVFTSATDLHLVPLSNITLNNLGTPIAGITTDIDGDARNATTPDIGVDEFTPATGADMGATALVAPASSGCYTNAETVTVTIKNYSVNPIDFSISPVTVTATATGPAGLTYSSSFVVSTGTLATGATQNVTLPATINMTAGGTYTFNASTSVSGDVTPTNDAMVPAVRTSSILAGGTYTVGTAGTYATLTAAITAYNNASCITGPIVFNLTDATYSTNETFPIIINANLAAGTNTLTIKPATGVNAIITGSAASNALIKLNGARYILIDGSNNGTTTQNLTITNTSTTSPTAVGIASLGTGSGAINNTIKNCILSVGTITSGASYGIAVGGTTPGTSGDDNDNCTLQNNSITGATIGIYANGTAAVSAGGLDNLIISNNTITTNTTVATLGIEVGNSLASSIAGNTVSVETTNSGSPVGISLETGFVSSSVTKNIITKVVTTSTGGWGGRGITVGTGTATSNITIANNFVSGVNGSNFTGFSNSSSMGIGIGMVGTSTTITTITGGVNLYYNTVSMYGSYDYAANNITAALYIGSGATALDIRNNILTNSMNNTNGSGTASKAYAIYSAVANTAFTTIDYNDYFVSGGQGVLGYLASDRTDLSGIIAGYGGNANSKNILPNFTAANNLHLVPATNALLDNLATPITGLTTDIDGDTRNATTPDMGGDEFTAPTCTGAVGGTATAPTITYCGPGTPAITASGYSTGINSGYQWQSSADNSNWNDIAGQTNPVALTLAGTVASTTYYRLKVTCPTGTALAYSTVVTITINPIPTVTVTPVGATTVCAPNSVTLNSTTTAGTPSYVWKNNGNAIAGATSNTYVAVTSGSYTLTVTDGVTTCSGTSTATAVSINALPGAITITPASPAICSNTIQQLTASVAGSGLNVTSGTGASTSNPSTTGIALGPNPLQNYYGGVKLQMLFTASELTALGLTSGPSISAIKLNLGAANTTYALQGLTVKMKNSSTVALSATAWETGLTTVRNAADFTPAVGLNSLILDNPFTWDGTSNLAIEINYSNNNGGAPSGTNAALYSPTTFVSTTMYRADNTALSVIDGYTTTANYSYNSRNDLTFVTSTLGTTWSPSASLYFDAAATAPYTGTATTTVYAKPLTTTPYTATATSAAGCTTTSTVTVTVNQATSITTQPSAVAVCSGANATFTVVAAGSGTLTYQWRKGGTNITGATNASYTITGATAADAANYDVVVTGGCGNITSSAVALSINAATAITTQPTAQTACTGGNVTFSVTATGTALTYQWRKGGTNITGATNATYTITGVTAADVANYDVVVTGTCGNSTSTAVALTVNGAPVITTQPVAQTACAGSNVTFTVVASGTGLTYQWRKGGVNISGATSSSLTLNGVSATDVASYDVVITSSCTTTATSAAASLTLNTATSITTQPIAQAVCTGSAASFTVAATGTGTLTYQWRKNTINISGATSATYSIASAAAADAGSYDVIVTGTCGSVTSGAVTLTLNAATVITTQPVAQTACAGTNVSFTVAATGNGTLTYQWRKGAVNISGATSATYTITGATAADAASYDVIVTGGCGSITSTAVSLTINAATVITTQPVAQAVCAGSAANFTVTATGTGTLTYQWRKGGTNITGATNSSYSIASVAAADAANYDVVVTGTCGSVTSTAVALTLNTATSITTQPAVVAACLGANATFTVVGAGSGTLTYQWRKGGTNITGATNASYTITGVTATDAANYDVVVTGGCGNVTSTAVALTINAVTAITTQPVAVSTCVNTAASFTVVATGTGTLTYQWRKGGVNIAGATSATYTIASVTATDAANYDVVVTGTCGSVTSTAVPLTVNTCTSVPTVDADITATVLMPSVVRVNSVLRVNASRATKITWNITDTRGRVVMVFTQKVNAGQNDLNLELGKLAGGAYQLSGYTDKGKTTVIRFVRL